MKEVRIKTIPEDFLVEEIATPDLGNTQDQYKYILIKKGFSTFDAIEKVSKICSVPLENISYCGLKDEEGITKQEITCSINLYRGFKEFNNLIEEENRYIKLYYIGKASKCSIGKLEGNAFTIMLRNIEKSYISSFECIKKKNIAFLNYYDYQRFGIPGYVSVTHLIGKELLEGNYDGALELFKLSGNNYNDDQIKDAALFFTKFLDPRKASFFKNAYSSYLWNQKLEKIVTNVVDERVRDESTGMKYNFVQNLTDILKIESEKEFLEYVNYNSGRDRTSRRNTVIHTNVTCSNIELDDFYKDRYKVRLHFVLPSGCYATTMIRQLCTDIL